MLLLIGSIILVVGLFLVLGANVVNNKLFWRLNKKQIIAPFGLLILLFGFFVQVNANEVGIVYDPFNGGIQTTALTEGIKTKSIFQNVTKLSTTNRTAEIRIAGQTEDSIYAWFEITIVYRVEIANAGMFYQVTGNNDITENQLSSITKEALQSATTNYDIYAVLGSALETVRIDFVTRLASLMTERYKLTLVSASFNDIDAGEAIEEIIQNKAQAIQQVQIAQQELAKAEVEAQTAVIKANADAQVVLINAEAQAEAQIILNSVTANAINTMYLSQFETDAERLAFETAVAANPDGSFGSLTMTQISEVVLKQLYYDTWDGKLPTVITDGAGLIIQP